MNVSARISDGLARRVAISQAIRRVMTWVLPVPAPATTSRGPLPWVTARSWSGLRPPSSASSPDPGGLATAGSITGTSSLQAGNWSSGAGSRRRRVRVRISGVAGVVVDVVGAMTGASPAAVTPRLSGHRPLDRGGLFLGQRGIARPALIALA